MSLLASFKNNVMRRSRAQKLDQFFQRVQPGQTVLDAGVSIERDDFLPSVNYFLKNYPYAPETYTGLGIDDITPLAERYPGKTFRTYDGTVFPFADKSFDWVFSNAVIEHVGDEAAQLFFLNEMLRVGRKVFFTTPNKFFPIEAHTNLPFLHWCDPLFYAWLERRGSYLNRDNLRLLGPGALRRIVQRSRAASFEIIKNRTLGLPMTFSVICG